MKLDLTDLIRRQKELGRIISKCEYALKDGPDGGLRVSVKKGYVQFFEVNESSGCDGVYIPKGQTAKVKGLANKEYYEKVLKDAQKEKALIDKLLAFEELEPVGRVYGKMHKEKQKLVWPIELPNDMNKEKWESHDYNKMGISPGQFCKKTKKGELVRSDAEMRIADLLLEYGVPFKYEFPWQNSTGKRAPDFFVLNVRTQRVWFWEHFGMLDNEGYREDFYDKLEQYANYDIYPGEGLIVTFSDKNHPLENKLIKKIIKDKLL